MEEKRGQGEGLKPGDMKRRMGDEEGEKFWSSVGQTAPSPCMFTDSRTSLGQPQSVHSPSSVLSPSPAPLPSHTDTLVAVLSTTQLLRLPNGSLQKTNSVTDERQVPVLISIIDKYDVLTRHMLPPYGPELLLAAGRCSVEQPDRLAHNYPVEQSSSQPFRFTIQ